MVFRHSLCLGQQYCLPLQELRERERREGGREKGSKEGREGEREQGRERGREGKFLNLCSVPRNS